MSCIVITDRVPVLTPGPARESVIYIKVKAVQITSDQILSNYFDFIKTVSFIFKLMICLWKKYTPDNQLYPKFGALEP